MLGRMYVRLYGRMYVRLYERMYYCCVKGKMDESME